MTSFQIQVVICRKSYSSIRFTFAKYLLPGHVLQCAGLSRASQILENLQHFGHYSESSLCHLNRTRVVRYVAIGVLVLVSERELVSEQIGRLRFLCIFSLL